jgi:hypothetical protein
MYEERCILLHLPMILHDVKVLMVASVIVRPPAEMIVPGAAAHH